MGDMSAVQVWPLRLVCAEAHERRVLLKARVLRHVVP
jgi:hypothetical protein